MDYHFKPIGKTCATTGKELPPGAAIISALVEVQGELVRYDYAVDAWSGPPENELGHWKTIVPLPEADKPRPLDTDALLQHLEQLCESPNPTQEKFAYVISLLLMQKRRLRLDGSRRDGDIEYLQFHGCRGEGTFEVRDQQLSDREIEELQRDLNIHLGAA